MLSRTILTETPPPTTRIARPQIDATLEGHPQESRSQKPPQGGFFINANSTEITPPRSKPQKLCPAEIRQTRKPQMKPFYADISFQSLLAFYWD